MSDASKTATEWIIAPGKVGSVELGKPMPAALLTADLEKHYIARYIADGQPIDAFQLDEPPLMIVIEKGPYAAAAKHGDPSGMPPTDKYRDKAGMAARGGALVHGVFVTGAGPKTEAGLGVGSTLADLQRAYPDFKIQPIPETMGKDLCVGRTKSLPGVGFFFEMCGKAKTGAPVVRVQLWP